MVLSTAQKGHHLTYISKSAADVLRAADDGNPKIKKALAAALKSLQAQVPDLTSLIATGNPALVMDAISKANIPQPLIDRVIDATVTTAIAGGMTDAARFSVAFNDVNDRAVRWATLNAAKDITSGGVGLATQAAIRDVMVNAVEAGVNPRVTAKLIEGMVPLDGHRAGQIQRFTDKAIEDGLDPDHIAKVVARKTARGIKFRAINIARTESLKAANRGQQLVWDAAKDLGYIPEGTKKVWDATGDSRTCQICMAMDGQPVEVSSEFAVTEHVKRPSAPKTPPAHPQCRCTMVLEHIPAGSRKQPATKPKPTYLDPNTGLPVIPRAPKPKPRVRVPQPVRPPVRPKPKPAPKKDLDWSDYGATLPRDKARRALVQDGLAKLNDLDDEVRARYVSLLGEFGEGIKFQAATKSTRSMRFTGQVTQKMERGTSLPSPAGRKLQLQMMRPNEEWDDWVKESNRRVKSLQASNAGDDAWNAHTKWKEATEPDWWRLATPDEFGDVLVHELTHANDFQLAYESGSKYLSGLRGGAATKSMPTEIMDEVWIMRYGGDRNWKASGNLGDPKVRDAYAYATSERVEAVAELGRFYNRGVSELGLSAEEWRTQNPVLATWVKETLYP